MGDAKLLGALRNSRLAPELTEPQLATLADHAFSRDLAPGEVLVNEGASDNHLYVLVSGALGVIRGHGSADPVSLFTLAPGDFVGELGFLDGTPHYAAIVALGPVHVVGIERERLESMLHKHPEVVYRVMRAIIRTVHQIQRRLSMQSAELTNYIYKQHGRY